jgi:Ca2+-binding EF-hand superfamily protein
LVNAHEVKRIIESRGFYVTAKEAAQVLKKFDDDKDGTVRFREF